MGEQYTPAGLYRPNGMLISSAAGFTFDFETPVAYDKFELYDTNTMPSGVAFPSMGGQYMDASYDNAGSYHENAMQSPVADQDMGGLEPIHAYNQSGSNGLNAMPPTMANTTFGASWATAENGITLESLYPRFAALPLDQQNYMLAIGQDPWSLALRNELALSGPAPTMQPQYVAPEQLQLQQPAAAPMPTQQQYGDGYTEDMEMPTQQQSGYEYAEDMGNDIDPNQDQGGYAAVEDLVMSGSEYSDESVQTPVPAVAPVAAAAPTAASDDKPFKCHLCPKKGFTAKSSLTEHLRKHSGAMLTCNRDPSCAGKEWANAKGLRRHNDQVHGDGGAKKQCKYFAMCGYECPRSREKDNMKRHMSSKHHEPLQ